MTLSEFHALPEKEAFGTLFLCCGCTNWAQQLAAARPFGTLEDVKSTSDRIWAETTESDWLEAFSHHPKIGDVKSLEKKFASTAAWASGEQASVQQASSDVIQRLAQGNSEYENRFGFIFIVCATGKSAAEMLELLENRLPNDRETELRIAADEQNKITHIRLNKLFA